MSEDVPTLRAAVPFGRALRRYRVAAGLTQEQLAERAGLSARAVSDLERDAGRIPRRDTMELLADALMLGPEERAALAATISRARPAPGTQEQNTPADGTDADTAEDTPEETGLPAQPTAFIGREREIEAVQARLLDPETRLLTLTGPGGVGKTRLALAVAAAARASFTDGVAFVPLAALTDPALVLPTVAGAVGVSEAPSQPLAQTLAEALRPKHLLLVLDNFEQVLPAGEAMLALLLAVPRVTALVTSRAALHVRGERLYPVPSLQVPTPPLPSLDALSQYEAVKLFIARAQDVDPGFSVTNETAPAVAEICARLDGLPLAIELAAARVRLLSPEALLARLSSRLKVATGGARDLPARQQTLRAAIEWSHALLDASEQVLFRRLAVFAGGRSLDAIEAVCAADGDLTCDVLDGVESLVDKSLLRREVGVEGAPRLVMLETIHEYARERLAESGEQEALRRAHAACFLALAEEAEPRLTGPEQGRWLNRLEQEHDNLRAVLLWAREVGGREVGARMGAALWRFWGIRSHVSEGRGWLDWFADHVDAGRVDGQVLVRLLNAAGVLAGMQGDSRHAAPLFERCLALARDVGDVMAEARALGNLAAVALEEGRYQRSIDLEQQAIPLYRAVGDDVGRSIALLNLGIAARFLRDIDRAMAWLEEGLALAEETGNVYQTSGIKRELGLVEVLRGDHIRAAALYRGAIEAFQSLKAETGFTEIIEAVAALMAARGQAKGAARLMRATDAYCAESHVVRAQGEQEAFEAQVAAVRAALGEEAFTQTWSEGAALSLNEAAAEALAWLRTFEAL